MSHDPMCRKANVMEIRFGNVCSQCELIARVRADSRKDAARDLRVWIHDNHPGIKGWADIPVEEMFNIIEGKTP
jgi:hypothetical protein